MVGSDPNKLGIVESFNRPSANATGVHIFTTALEAKRLAMLHDLVPNAQTIGILVNPGFPCAADEVHQIEAAAHGLGQQVLILRASTPAEFDAAFDLVTREHIRALSVSAEPFPTAVVINWLRLRSAMRCRRCISANVNGSAAHRQTRSATYQPSPAARGFPMEVLGV